MSTKQMKFDADARDEFRSGVEQIARAVAVTMGPTGRHVAVQKSFGGPTITKDGVSVAKEVELPQPFENMGAKMINQVAKKVSDEAGDGTTAATILAKSIYVDGLRHVTAGDYLMFAIRPQSRNSGNPFQATSDRTATQQKRAVDEGQTYKGINFNLSN